MEQYTPVDPYYDEVVDAKGKVKKVKVSPKKASILLSLSQVDEK